MISPFEYVTVLISIILGLGITQIVTGIADIIHHWKRVKLYWPHTLWMVVTFFLHIQEWWNVYDLRTIDKWRLPTFLFISLYPINLFVLARLLFPAHNSDEAELDYKEFYLMNYKKIFAVIVCFAFLSAIENLALAGRGVEGVAIQLAIIFILGITALRRQVSELVHKAIVLLWLAVIVISVIVNWNSWLIT